MMSTRELILKGVKENKPAALPLPAVSFPASKKGEIVEEFKSVLKTVGGNFITVTSVDQVAHSLLETYGSDAVIVNRCAFIAFAGASEIDFQNKEALDKIEVAVVEGRIGVAESAAIWVSENEMGHRAVPFICQHLVIVLSVRDMVRSLHEAYAVLPMEACGFGVFISGPSKTADIEQSLVIGAHGARSLTVYLTP